MLEQVGVIAVAVGVAVVAVGRAGTILPIERFIGFTPETGALHNVAILSMFKLRLELPVPQDRLLAGEGYLPEHDLFSAADTIAVCEADFLEDRISDTDLEFR